MSTKRSAHSGSKANVDGSQMERLCCQDYSQRSKTETKRTQTSGTRQLSQSFMVSM